MKQITLFIIVLAFIGACKQQPDANSGATAGYNKTGNSVFHQTDETKMFAGTLEILGEVKNPGIVDFDKLYKREVIAKEALEVADSVQFVGAYRYKGFSLFDILNPFMVEKKNKDKFRPEIDLYVVIENAKGDSVTFSWSELFYSSPLHNIIIATESAPVKPHKTEVNYPVSATWKIVAANDLLSIRNLENPTKITVKSFDQKEYKIEKGLDPCYSENVKVIVHNQLTCTVEKQPKTEQMPKYNSIFYGMGKGFHGSPVFQGPDLANSIAPAITAIKNEKIGKSLICVVGIDGYRVIYSYSELFNRADQIKAILDIPENNNKTGYYRFYHPANFFADYSVRGLMKIYFF